MPTLRMAGMSSEMDYFVIGDVGSTKLTFQEFLAIERTDIAEDLAGRFLDGRSPLFAYFSDPKLGLQARRNPPCRRTAQSASLRDHFRFAVALRGARCRSTRLSVVYRRSGSTIAAVRGERDQRVSNGLDKLMSQPTR